jgi:hypothetical protein
MSNSTSHPEIYRLKHLLYGTNKSHLYFTTDRDKYILVGFSVILAWIIGQPLNSRNPISLKNNRINRKIVTF